MQTSLLRSLFKKQLIQNSLSYDKQHITILLKKTVYLYKTTYYNLFFKNNLFKTAYLCKTICYDLFLKNNLFKTFFNMQNNLLQSLIKK